MKTSHITNEQRLLASALFSPFDLFFPLGNHFSPVSQQVFINDEGVGWIVCSPLIRLFSHCFRHALIKDSSVIGSMMLS